MLTKLILTFSGVFLLSLILTPIVTRMVFNIIGSEAFWNIREILLFSMFLGVVITVAFSALKFI